MINTEIKTKNKLFLSALIVLFFALFSLYSFPAITLADDDEEIEEEIESLEEKAAKYQQLLDLTQQEKTSLENQMQMMDIQINKLENDVEITKEDIERNNMEIKEAERRIQQKENELSQTKEDLAEMLRLFHQIDQELGLEFLSSDGSISTVLNQSEYIEQTSRKVDEILGELRDKKSELESRQEEYKKKNEELEGQKETLTEKISYVGSEKLSKNILLEKTEGKEQKYQELLERVEKQKMELIGDLDSLSSEKRKELDEILEDAPKPKSGLASEKWYYAQDDKDWAYKRIGLSSSLMKDYGCAVTALSMVFTFHDEDITPGKLSSQPIFYRDLIVWPQSWKSLELDSSIYHGNINWSDVKKSLKKDRPVIVFIRSGTGAGHYVVIHSRDKNGEYVVHDPLFGPNIYLDTTRDLVGAIYGTSTTIDQMLIYKD